MMKPRSNSLIGVLLMVIVGGTVSAQTPVGTAFTYQGQLKQAGVPVTGAYDILFTLHDAEYGDSVVGTPIQAEDLPVNEGLFTIALNFGSEAFGGQARWLEIAVRPGASTGEYTTLDPRQLLTTAPYALYALQSGGASNADLLDGLDSTAFLQAVPNPLTLAGDQPGGHVIKGSNSSGENLSCGVFGEVSGPGSSNWACGVYGLNNTLGAGVHGKYTGAWGNGVGVYGESGGGSGVTPGHRTGVWGDSGTGCGVLGGSTEGWGVAGIASGSTGVNYGVCGATLSSSGYGVFGDGESGVGVCGESNWNDAIVAVSTAEGRSGVYARNDAAAGTAYGVYAKSVSDAGTGVLGEATATSGTTYGVRGRSLSPDGYGGYFEGRGYFSGSVGIGTNAPVDKLDVQGGALRVWNTDVGLTIDPAPGEECVTLAYARPYGNVSKMRIYSNKVVFSETGNVGMGVADPSQTLDVGGTARLRGMSSGAGTAVVVDPNGVLYKLSSSRRYKHDVADLPAAGDAVLGLRPVSFAWNSTGQPDIGLIAEEVAEVLPDLVICDAEGQPDGVKYDKVALYLLDVVKAQREQLVTQQNELANLRTRLEKIEAALGEQTSPRDGGVR